MTTSKDIPGAPSVLAVELGSGQPQAAALSQRICDAARRQGTQIYGPFTAATTEQLLECLSLHPGANCWFLIASAEIDGKAAPSWRGWLPGGLLASQKLLAVYAPGMDQGMGETALRSAYPWAHSMLVARPAMTPRQAALFFPEFFGELTTHCSDSISLPVVRFCFRKANRFAPGAAEIWA